MSLESDLFGTWQHMMHKEMIGPLIVTQKELREEKSQQREATSSDVFEDKWSPTSRSLMYEEIGASLKPFVI